MSPEKNGWTAWSKHVLHELERLNVCFERLDKEYNELRVDFEKLKTSSMIKWTLLSSVVTLAAAILLRKFIF